MKIKHIFSLLFAICIIPLSNTLSAQTENLNQSSGLIMIDADQYMNDMYRVWNVNTGVNKPVKITFYSALDYNDYVDFYSVDKNGTATLLKSMTGINSGETFSTIYATGKIIAVFTTNCCESYADGYPDVWGFEADFSVDDSYTVSENSIVNGTQIVYGDALISGNASVGGNTSIIGNETVKGNLGVGIASPEAKLHVLGSTPLGNTAGNYALLTRIEGNVNNNRVYVNDYMLRESNGSYYTSASYLRGISVNTTYQLPTTLRSWIKQIPWAEKIEFGSSGVTYMSVGRKVGIGTAIPKGILHLKSPSANYFDGSLLFENSSSTSVYGLINSNNDLCLGYNSNVSGGFPQNDYQHRLIIKSDGNVGIGVTSPQHKLDVKGTICADEVLVKTVDWADFVFDKNYKLRDLKEVDQYIQEHGRLPEIPSTAEVKENGVNIVEVQAKLLQKLEELTLYTIQLKKEIEQLKAAKK